MRLTKSIVTILTVSLSISAAHGSGLCIGVYAKNIKDAQPAAVPPFVGSMLKGFKGFKDRKQIILENEKLLSDQAELQTHSSDKTIEITSMLIESYPRLSAPFREKLQSEVEPLANEIKNATSKIVVNHLVLTAKQKHDQIVKEYSYVKEFAKQARQSFVTKLESVPRYKNTETLEPINDLLSKIAAATNVADAQRITTEGMTELSRKMSDFETKEAARKINERRLGETDLQNAELIMTSYLESIRKIEPSFEGLAQQSAELIGALKISPEFRNFIYREMQFLRRTVRLGVQNRTSSIELRIRNNLEISRQFQSAYQTNPASAESALKMKLVLRSKVKELFSPSRITIINEDFRHVRLTHDVREVILRDSLRQPELLTTLLTLTLKYPQIPAEPVKPSAPVKPALYTKRDFKGKSPATIKNMVATMNTAIAKFSDEAKSYPARIQAHSAAKLAYQAKVKEIKQTQQRIKNARASFASYLALTAPQIFTGSSASNNNVQAKQTAVNQIHHNIRSLSTANYQRMVTRYPQYSSQLSRYRNDRTPVIHNDQTSFFDMWMMASITGNPMWFISPTFARVQLFMDLVSHGTFNHNHPQQDPVLQGYRDEMNLQNPTQQIHTDFTPISIKEQIEGIRQNETDDVAAGLRAESQVIPADSTIIDNQSKQPVIVNIDPLLRVEPISELDSADALLRGVQSKDEIAEIQRAADQEAIEANRVQEEAQRESDQALRESEQAQRDGEQAQRESEQAQREAEQAQQEAAQAQREAEQAQQEAAQAQREAEQAQQEAAQAQREAEQAQQEAAQAQREAEQAQQEAAQAQREAEQAQQEAAQAQQEAAAAESSPSYSSDSNNNNE